MQQSSLFDDDPLEYLLIRSARRTLSVSVEDHRVVVRAPKRAPVYWIEDFLLQKQGWIKKQLSAEREKQARRLRLQQGLRFELAGEPMQLQISMEPGRRQARVVERDSALSVMLPETGSEWQDYLLHRVFIRWVKQRATAELGERTRSTADRFGLEEQLGEVRLRQTKTKWGHCTSEGHIQYNPLILLAPEPVIDYLVAHEVAHLQHRNHSKRFWKLVEKMQPGFRDNERWLKEEGYRISLEAPPRPEQAP